VNNRPTYLSKDGLEKLRTELDEMTSVKRPEVAGSIAGDDTLFIAFPDRGSLQRIKRRLVRLAE
jgi:arginine repressor